jgi:hypothetical protein
MFFPGVLVGCVLGTTVCLAAALWLAADARPERAVRPALVPLHVSAGTLVSLN